VLADQQDAIPMTTALVREPVLLSEVADRLGLCESDLRRWNPEIVRNVVPPTKDGYPLRMPEQYVEAYPAVEPSLSVLEISDVLMHRIRPGDSLSRIARTYKVSVKQIMQFNPNLQPSRLRLGREIAVPVPGVRTRSRLAKNISENVETPMMDLADDLREAGRDRICHKTRRAGIDYATSGKKSQLRKASVRVQQPKKRLARDVRRTTRTRR
jgi:LysM repeat protein